MSISPVSYMVKWSMRPACTRVLDMVHSGQKMSKIAQKWPKMRTLMVGANEAHARLGPECAIGLVSSQMFPTYLLGVAQPLRFWEWQGRQASRWFWIVPSRQHGCHGMPSPRGVIRGVQDMLGTEVCTLITYLGHDVNWAQRRDTRLPLDIMTGKKQQYARKNTEKCLERRAYILEDLRPGLSNRPILLNTMT